jgi:hypothetical protein
MRRNTLAPVVVLIAAATLAACGHSSPPPASHRLSGEYDVHAVYRGPPQTGAPCQAATVGYADIHPGTSVTVLSGGGRRLGATTLGAGTLRVTQGEIRSDCVYLFALTVPDEAIYRIEVAGRGAVPFSKNALLQAHWHADLAIGNYSLGT